MFGFRINHQYGAWGAGFDTLTDAIKAAVEEASFLDEAVEISLTYEGKAITSFMLVK